MGEREQKERYIRMMKKDETNPYFNGHLEWFFMMRHRKSL